MFAKFVGRRATALATSLVVVIGLAITPAFTATAAEGDEPVAPVAELVEAPVPPAEPAPPAEVPLVPAVAEPVEAPNEEPAVEAPAPVAEPAPVPELVEAPATTGETQAQSPIAPLGARQTAPPAGAQPMGFQTMGAFPATSLASTGISPSSIGPFVVREDVDIQFSTDAIDVRWTSSFDARRGVQLSSGGHLTGMFLELGVHSALISVQKWVPDLTGGHEIPGSGYWATVQSKLMSFQVLPAITTASLPRATLDVPYSQILDATMFLVPVRNKFKVVENSLPPGMTLNEFTGVISGTVSSASAPATYNFAVQVTVSFLFLGGSYVSAPRPLSITVGYAAPTVTTTILPAATVGTAYTAPELTASGDGAITWSATGLPSGLVLDSATGIISGTPDYNPAYGVTAAVPVTVTANNGVDSAPQTLTLTMTTPAPAFGAPRLPAATVGMLYDQPLPVSNAYGDLTYALVGARSLPSGLQLTADGRILGTPDYDPAAGESKAVTIRVQVTGPAGSDEQPFRFNLRTPAPEITTTTLTDGWWKQAYSQPIAASGPGVVLTVTGLPTGLHFDGTTVTGTTRKLGTFELQVTAINTAGVDVENVYLTINDKPTLYRMPVVKMQTGDTFTGFPMFSGQETVLVLGSDAPVGMKLNQNNRIKWAPSAPGVYTFSITATNPAGTDTQEYTFKVFDAPVITQGALDQGVTTVNYRQELQHDGTNVKFTVVKGDLPNGITLSRKGVLEGTPTEAGTFQFRVKAQNPVGVDRQWFTLTVTEPAMTLSSSSVVRGGSLIVSGTGYLPGDKLELWLHSTPVLLGTVTATGGTFTSTVKIPENTPAGQHHLVVTATQSGTQSVPLNIALPAPPPQQPRSTTQSQSPQLAVTPSVEATAIDESDDSHAEEIVDEAEEELPTLNKPEAEGETTAATPANWMGLLLAALVLLIAALLVAFLLWRRRMASGS